MIKRGGEQEKAPNGQDELRAETPTFACVILTMSVSYQ